MGVVCLRVLSGTALEFNALLEHTPKFRRRAMLAPLNREVTHIEQVSSLSPPAMITVHNSATIWLLPKLKRLGAPEVQTPKFE
eukprot:8069075-Pyramimonas_sp.AAC.1